MEKNDKNGFPISGKMRIFNDKGVGGINIPLKKSPRIRAKNALVVGACFLAILMTVLCVPCSASYDYEPGLYPIPGFSSCDVGFSVLGQEYTRILSCPLLFGTEQSGGVSLEPIYSDDIGRPVHIDVVQDLDTFSTSILLAPYDGYRVDGFWLYTPIYYVPATGVLNLPTVRFNIGGFPATVQFDGDLFYYSSDTVVQQVQFDQNTRYIEVPPGSAYTLRYFFTLTEDGYSAFVSFSWIDNVYFPFDIGGPRGNLNIDCFGTFDVSDYGTVTVQPVSTPFNLGTFTSNGAYSKSLDTGKLYSDVVLSVSTPTSTGSYNPITEAFSTVEAFLDLNLAPGITIGGVSSMLFSAIVVFFVLKHYLGG